MLKCSADFADKSAIVLSGICIAHCILPILLSLIIPYFAGFAFLTDDVFHLWLLLFVVPISMLAIGWGYYQHRSGLTLTLALTGLCMIFFAATYGHDMFGHGVEVLLSSLGSILVVFGHYET
jgi:hypothetical protein